MKIDAHQHFWNYDPLRHDWITDEMSVIRQSFTPEDIQPLLAEHGFDACVLIQVQQSEEETTSFLELAQQHAFIGGVVGWLDLRANDLGERIDTFAQDNAFKGVRHILQAEPEGFMTDPRFIAGVTELAKKDLSYDILTTESQLPEVLQFIDRLPEMRLVIDHLSKPDIKNNSFDQWAEHMNVLSQYEHVHVKLSGMATEACWQTWQAADLKPYIDYCLEQFGPSRLMFGSDWPVCLIAGSYGRVLDSLLEAISELSTDEKNQILGETAATFYRI
ncbi:MAG: amidohydrolase family protein [Verrucomicrobiota bacterium]